MTAKVLRFPHVPPLRRTGELTLQRAAQLTLQCKWQATITVVNSQGRAELLDYLFNGWDEFYCTVQEGHLGGEIAELMVKPNPFFRQDGGVK